MYDLILYEKISGYLYVSKKIQDTCVTPTIQDTLDDPKN